MEFNALVDFDTLSTKAKLLALLDTAQVIVEHDVRISGKTLDDAELADADCEDAFETLRTMLKGAERAVKTLVDA